MVAFRPCPRLGNTGKRKGFLGKVSWYGRKSGMIYLGIGTSLQVSSNVISLGTASELVPRGPDPWK